MIFEGEKWVYSVVTEYNTRHYSNLLTEGNLVSMRTPINIGTKDEPDRQAFFILSKNKTLYALHEDYVDQLPIMIDETKKKFYGRKVYDIITKFRSAKYVPERKFSFRRLVDELVNFEHTNEEDFKLWRLIAITSCIGRLAVRIASNRAFGKDSALKVLGLLLGDVVVVSNPSVAKLEYVLFNKVVVLNELANLTGEEKRNMEHFLLSAGDFSPVYEKRTRATESTRETYDIRDLSLILMFNDKKSYPDGSRYFDDVFQEASRGRFLPLLFSGKISQHIIIPTNPKKVAEENAQFYKDYIRSVIWYRQHWFEEYEEKKKWGVKDAFAYGLEDRWASNFETIRQFIILYSDDEEEAKRLTELLFKKHKDYLKMVGAIGSGLSEFTMMPLEEIEERISE